jgi:UDP-glucose 4-epimerase
VRHLLAAMDRASSQSRVFNVCTGEATSIMALAQTIGQVLRQEPVISRQPPRQGDIRMSLGNPRRAREALEVAAETALNQGLQATIAAAA